VGDLVFTAFSGSHQDAIKKGLAVLDPAGPWDVPYLPIDPADLGRSYESIIRVNSQSGKGGVAYLLERDYQLVMPRRLQIEFSRVVQVAADGSGREFTAHELWNLFEAEYLASAGPIHYRSHQLVTSGDGADREGIALHIQDGGMPAILEGAGTGPIDAAVCALDLPIDVVDYAEHSRGTGSDAMAVTYIEVSTPPGVVVFGVGMHANIVTASLLAVISAVNRAIKAGAVQWPAQSGESGARKGTLNIRSVSNTEDD
jgi:2-isopropylmalate synthase